MIIITENNTTILDSQLLALVLEKVSLIHYAYTKSY